MFIRHFSAVGIWVLSCSIACAAPFTNAELNKQVSGLERAFGATM